MSPSSPAGSSSSSSSLLYTNTLLALPDGPISVSSDLSSHTISLLGGYPTFSTLPESISINCGVCHDAIPLLTQVYCPLENGENDRTLYVFGCNKAKCQRRDGSIRAFRASVKNEEYVRDVQEKKEKREKEEAEEKARAKINPFTISDTKSSMLFGNGPSLFGAASLNPFGAPSSTVAASNPLAVSMPSSTPPDLSALSISPSMKLTTLAPPLPAYQPPLYLTTIEEYLLPTPEVEMESDDESEEEETPEEKEGWQNTTWETLIPKHVDEVFERFVRRLGGADGGSRQVLRYDFDGIPLPYASTSPLYKQLFPTATKASAAPDEEFDLSTLYSPTNIPTCPKCASKRVFELQLVPSLITLLRPENLSSDGRAGQDGQKKQVSEEERKRLLAKIAAGEDGEENEMEWGTIMVFGCKNDCVGFSEEYIFVHRSLAAVLPCLIVIAPFLAFQYYAYRAFCMPASTRPWCESSFPMVYSFVQGKYWNVGFLKYWTPAQIPNLLIASPVLFVSLYGSHTVIWSRTNSTETIFHLHHLFLTMLLILSSHTQIALRVVSGDPVFWWNVRSMAFGDKGMTRMGRAWVSWTVVWGAISIVLWAGHYPPA
ncbi:pre-rRNA-processing protein TSR4, partial [Tremellales sp. Uapishka_1]